MIADRITEYTDPAGLRFYDLGETRYPSVGQILKATEPPKFDALGKWRADVGDEVADLKTELSCERGKRLEQAIEAYLVDGVGAELTLEILGLDPFFESALHEIAKIRADAEPGSIEVQIIVVHDSDRYAGTLDIRYRSRQDGRRKIADWKSYAKRDAKGKTKTKSRAQMFEALCQVAAYVDADAWMTGERADGRAILCIPERPARVFDVGAAEQAAWRERRYTFMQEQRA